MPPAPDGPDVPATSIVMPAYNEADMLEQSVGDVVEGLRGSGRPFEVIVVENGSRDGTEVVADRIATATPEVQSLHLPGADYGAALRAGLLAARGDIVVCFDVDYYDLAFVVTAQERLDAADAPAIVVGSKRAVGARDERNALRRLVTTVFSAVLRHGFGLRVSDTHGMKALRRALVEPIAEVCRFGSDLFDTELVLRAERAGLLTVELPVVVVERRPSRSSIVRRVPRTVWGLVRLRLLLGRDHAPGATS